MEYHNKVPFELEIVQELIVGIEFSVYPIYGFSNAFP